MMEHGTVYAVVVKMYEYGMGPTYCDCCGPEPVLEESGTHLDSVHRTIESAEYCAKVFDEVNIPDAYYYDNFEVVVREVPLK